MKEFSSLAAANVTIPADVMPVFIANERQDAQNEN
jgi:hypothetical protein